MGWGLDTFLSGGAANSDQDLSLGGAISSTSLGQQSCLFDDAGFAGLTLESASGLASGVTYVLTHRGGNLYLKRDGGAEGVGALLSADDDYIVQSNQNTEANGILRLGYVSASFTAAENEEHNITITDPSNNLFDAVSSAESASGRTEYRAFYFKNNHATENYALELFIASQNTVETFSIGLQPEGKNFTPSLLAAETDVPASVVFSQPADVDSALSAGTLVPTDYVVVWVKREIPAGNMITAAGRFLLSVRALVS